MDNTKDTTTPPALLPFDISSIPKLNREQAGHLRHFHNIAAADDGDWPHMGTPDPEQAFVDAYRYQLATMVYASAVTHYHRLPAMTSLFKPLISRLIHKMLLPHVWNYWYLTSQSSTKLDPDLKELRRPWADPIIRENIMYSGHLLMMVSLYAMLFDDDEFERNGSLVFEWKPMFWGMGSETYIYNTMSLQDAILAEMRRLDWVGVCCEPNMVFVVCNQFPLIGTRLNDVRNGTNVAGEVLTKYWEAIQKKHMISDDGLFVDALMVKQSFPRRATSVGFTAWAGAHMNTWNPTWVRNNFARQSAGYITSINGETRIQAPAVANEIRRLMREEGVSADAPAVLDRSKRVVNDASQQGSMFQQPLFGYVAEWLSELGKEHELQSLLRDIDEKHPPIWEDGGMRYGRDDRIVNTEGEWTRMDPFSANAGIAYGRLNVRDGLKIIWDKPRQRGYFDKQPFVSGIGLGSGVDCLRGVWDERRNAMIVTLKAIHAVNLKFSMSNLTQGRWAYYMQGYLQKQVEVNQGGDIKVQHKFEVGEEVDFVMLRV